MHQVAIVGADGRMGKTLIKTLIASTSCHLSGALTRSDSPNLGRDAGALIGQAELGVTLSETPDEALKGADVVVDFSLPEVAIAIVEACAGAKIALVSGTTGLNAEQQDRIRACAASIAIVQAANFSPGVHRLNKLIEQLATSFLTTDTVPDVEIIETHHQHKIDAPSGTALQIGQTVAAALGRDFARCAVLDRQTNTGAKAAEAIGFSSVRSGEAVGEHRVIFATQGESLTISHQAYSRSAFAEGAINAACWALKQAPGLYGVADVMAAS